MNAGVAVLVAVLLWGASGLQAQEERPLTLDEAVARALEGNATLDEARLQARAADAGVREAAAFLWPTVGAEAGFVRSDDPVAVFGTKLRQGRFGEADFAIPALNQPDPVNDWTLAAGASWSVLDPARWSAREAARWSAEAAGKGADRTREAVIFRTRALYFQAVRADGQVRADERALEAARATAERIRRRRDEGILTDAHVFQARAEVEGARAQLTEAERIRASARADLAVYLGWPGDRVPVPVDTVMAVEAPEGRTFESLAVEDRADLLALEAQVAAAEARESRAFRSRFPAVEGFTRLSTHARDFTGDREENWTVGVQLSVPVFTGFGLSARRDAAELQKRAAEIRLTQARREARAELEDAARSVESARDALKASRAAARAAREGRRLLTRRFEEGMATVAELLQAEARAARMESRAVDALAMYQIALARLEFAAGSASSTNPSRDR